MATKQAAGVGTELAPGWLESGLIRIDSSGLDYECTRHLDLVCSTQSAEVPGERYGLVAQTVPFSIGVKKSNCGLVRTSD